MTEHCWWCNRELPDDDTPGIVLVIHEAKAEHGDHVVRRTCNTTCARRACTWTADGNYDRDQRHTAHTCAPSAAPGYTPHTTDKGTSAQD